MATQFHRTVSSAGSDYKATFSAWVKRATPGVENFLLYAYYNSSNNHRLNFLNSDELHINIITSASNSATITTNRKFRDPNAWYHIVVAWDSTQSTASDRIKIYVNGVQETSFSTSNYPSQNADMFFNKNTNGLYLGGQDGSNQFQGVMSHVHYVDGTAYSASTFGSTDSITGEWRINTSPSVTYGTNGWLVFKDGNTYTDQSSNSNNLTLTGTAPTKTEDCPSNVFATINPLDNYYNSLTLSNGNTSWVSGSPYSVTRSTLGASSGKYYFEMKVVNEGNTDYEFGIVGAAATSTSSWMGSSGSYGYAYESNAELRANGTTVDPWGSTYDDGDILGCAFDLDNNKIYFSKNGSWQESGDPSSGSNGYTIIAAADTPAGAYFVGAGDFSGSSGQSGQFNFGNGYFGTTAVSSAGTNASNLGIFEYDVPSGFTALCTKGLNE